MKKLLPYILISAFLLPIWAHAATVPATVPGTVKASDTVTQTSAVQPISPDSTILNTQLLDGKPLSVQKTVLKAALTDILNRFTTLSAQTQQTINQINASGLTTDQPQDQLIAANASLAKAKLDIDKLSTQSTIDDLKYSVKVAEDELHTSRVDLLQSLASLQATLPTLDSVNQ
jgi:hypothetical protein